MVRFAGCAGGSEGGDSQAAYGAWHTSNIKWFSGIGEYIIDWGPGYRIYLAKEGETLIVLFGGGTRKRQQVDIKKAIDLHAEYKRRKQETKDDDGKSKDSTAKKRKR